MTDKDITFDPRVIGFRPDGRPIYAISGAQDDGDGPGTGASTTTSTDTGNAGDGGGDGDGTDDGGGDADKDWKAEAEKWKAHARRHETRAKTNADAAKRIKEIEDADKSATQKLAEAEQRAAAADARALRLEVAAEKGLTPAQSKRLVGTTREEMEADADELLSTFTQASDTDGSSDKGITGRPKEKLRSGAAPLAEAEDNDPRKLAESIGRDRF